MQRTLQRQRLQQKKLLQLHKEFISPQTPVFTGVCLTRVPPLVTMGREHVTEMNVTTDYQHKAI